MGMEEAVDSRWALGAEERILVMSKNRIQRLPFGLLLLFYRTHGRFPQAVGEIARTAAEHVAGQLGVPADDDNVTIPKTFVNSS